MYLNTNLTNFARRDSSLGYKLTRYVDGLDSQTFDRLKDWQNDKTHLKLDRKILQDECKKLIQEVHSSTVRSWDGYHCIIGIYKLHAVVLFIPIESKDTPYSQTGWCNFSCSFPVDMVRAHLAFSEETDEEYAVYFETLTKHYEEVKLFLYCNILTSHEALASLVYTTALTLGNYRQLESDCLEFAKAVAKQARSSFATKNSHTDLEMDKFDPQALDDLTITSLKSEALSRRKAVSKYSMISILSATQCTQLLLMIMIALTSAALVVFLYDRFK